MGGILAQILSKGSNLLEILVGNAMHYDASDMSLFLLQKSKLRQKKRLFVFAL